MTSAELLQEIATYLLLAPDIATVSLGGANTAWAGKLTVTAHDGSIFVVVTARRALVEPVGPHLRGK